MRIISRQLLLFALLGFAISAMAEGPPRPVPGKLQVSIRVIWELLK